jgi:hypothetical protein
MARSCRRPRLENCNWECRRVKRMGIERRTMEYENGIGSVGNSHRKLVVEEELEVSL